MARSNFEILKKDMELAAEFLEKAFLASRFKKRQNWFYKNFDGRENLKVWLNEKSEKKFSDSEVWDIWFWFAELFGNDWDDGYDSFIFNASFYEN